MSVIVKGCGGENVTPEVQAQNIKMDDISTTYDIPARADGTTNKEQLQSNNGWLDGAKQKMSKELLPKNICFGETVMGIDGNFSSSDTVSLEDALNGPIDYYYDGTSVAETDKIMNGYGAFIDGMPVIGNFTQIYETVTVAVTDGMDTQVNIDAAFSNIAEHLFGVYGGGFSSNGSKKAVIVGMEGYIDCETGPDGTPYVEHIVVDTDGVNSVYFNTDGSGSYPDNFCDISAIELVVVGA